MRGLSCSVACGIFPDQGLNPCPLHWQVDSQPLRHQGSPLLAFFIPFCYQELPWPTENPQSLRSCWRARAQGQWVSRVGGRGEGRGYDEHRQGCHTGPCIRSSPGLGLCQWYYARETPSLGLTAPVPHASQAPSGGGPALLSPPQGTECPSQATSSRLDRPPAKQRQETRGDV